MKKCPLCQKELNAQAENGTQKYICDCTGSPRVVIEVLPDNEVKPAAGFEKKPAHK